MSNYNNFLTYINDNADFITVLLTYSLILSLTLFLYGVVRYIANKRKNYETTGAKWMLIIGLLLSVTLAGLRGSVVYVHEQLHLEYVPKTQAPGHYGTMEHPSI